MPRLAIVWLFILSASSASAAEVDFNRDVAPILVKRCLECHSDTTASGSLILSTKAGLHKGGDSGPPITPKDVEGSELFQRVSAGEMPPEKAGKSQKLPDAEIAVLQAWIASGANWPDGRNLDLYEATSDVRGGRDWWAFQPVRRPELPSQNSTANPVDAFVQAKLTENGLTAAPPATTRHLLRRLYIDLIGLPPTAEEIDAFLADTRPDAYERLVDRLLASPHFGERWGRYWLDLVRYADTCGYERDQEKPGAWKYRDWVIRALSEDKPYNRFIQEQLAGDELPNRTEDSVIATGFLRLGTWNDEPNDPDEYKYERLEDMVHATTTAFLGLTVKCARCHDHKFDPIPQRDYYRVASAFWPGPIEPRQRELLGGPTKEELGFDVLGWTDIRQPPPLYLLKKGDHRHPLGEVVPGQLTVVSLTPAAASPPRENATGRRTAIAQWIADPGNPLTARVAVNRLWLHHFGQGLVRSPNNFGFKGDPPTHPELLDWLAGEFVRNGWHSKPIHKLLVMSQTYRQASVHPRADEYNLQDSGNHFWWRAERRRLDAEALRDAMLAASGQLDLRAGGPSFKPEISAEALEGLSRKSAAWQASPPAEQHRRSVYMFAQRSLLPPMMTAFDMCDTTEPCGQRDVSIVAPQALALMNNPFSVDQSNTLARRVERHAGPEAVPQVRAAWRTALGRLPAADEEAASLEHLRQAGLASLCHVLLNSNEFAFVD